jgi:hypothetical protein
MAIAKQAQSRPAGAAPAARGGKGQPSRKKNLPELYARLEKSQPGSEESKRISAEIIDAIG